MIRVGRLFHKRTVCKPAAITGCRTVNREQRMAGKVKTHRDGSPEFFTVTDFDTG